MDDPDCARIRNEIKKNKPYHLAHTEAHFLLKNSTYLASSPLYLNPPPQKRRTTKKFNARKGHEYENYNCQL